MTRIKFVVSGVIGATLIILGALSGDEAMLIGMIALGLGVAWALQCVVYVQEQTVVQVVHKVLGVTVKMLEPGLNFIIWPVEVPRRPISTRIVIDEGVTLGGRSADGVPFAFSWAVWYQLTPQNIPPDRLAATVDLLLHDTHKVLNNLVGYTLRRLITQKTAVEMAKNEGFQILDRYFRPYLRRETQEEGFLIHRVMIEALDVPPEMQATLIQAAGIDAEVGSVAQAGQHYERMTQCYTAAQLEWIERMEMIRAMRKGGSVVNLVSNNHHP